MKQKLVTFNSENAQRINGFLKTFWYKQSDIYWICLMKVYDIIDIYIYTRIYWYKSLHYSCNLVLPHKAVGYCLFGLIWVFFMSDFFKKGIDSLVNHWETPVSGRLIGFLFDALWTKREWQTGRWSSTLFEVSRDPKGDIEMVTPPKF